MHFILILYSRIYIDSFRKILCVFEITFDGKKATIPQRISKANFTRWWWFLKFTNLSKNIIRIFSSSSASLFSGKRSVQNCLCAINDAGILPPYRLPVQQGKSIRTSSGQDKLIMNKFRLSARQADDTCVIKMG